MLWFILDSQKLPAIFKDRHKSYAVVDVIKTNVSLAVLDSSFESEKESDDHEFNESTYFCVSELMIAQFFGQ